MAKQACPVCRGSGLVTRPPHIAGDQDTWTDSRTAPYTCPVCRGTGLVEETDD